jgi:hypothetical protein
LRTQGFKIGQVANDPLGKRIPGVGEVRHGQIGAAGATIVETRLAGARVVLDKRTDETVDLVLGNTFSVLSAPPKKAPSSASKPNPSPTGSC